MTMMEMAQLLGNFGEFIGAIAVVVTLIYLSIQVKQGKEALDANTNATKAGLSYQASYAIADQNHQLANEPELLQLMWQEAQDQPPSFSQEEEFRLWTANRSVMQATDGLYYLYKNGLVDEELWSARLNWTRGWLSKPILRTGGK